VVAALFALGAQLALLGPQAALAAGRTDLACQPFDRLLAARLPLAGALEARRGLVACEERHGGLPALETRFRAAVAAHPADAAAHYALALTLATRSPRGLAEARRELEAALGLAATAGLDPPPAAPPAAAEIAYRLGLLLLEDEQFAAARPRLEAALAAMPTRVAVRLAMAEALAELGHGLRVAEVLGPVPELGPTAAEIGRGQRLLARLANPFRGLAPKVASRYRQALDLLDRRDLPGRAAEELRELAREQPQEGAVQLLLGLCELRLGNDAEAVAALTVAAERLPENAAPLVYLGAFHEARGRGERALGCFQQALRRNPLEARATAAMARLREGDGDLGEAERLLRRLVALQPDDAGPLRSLGRVAFAAGDLDVAESTWRRLLGREPGSYEAHFGLGLIRKRQALATSDGQRAEALVSEARRYLTRAGELRPGDSRLEAELRSLSGKARQ
jgi:tetratricopeptide (TPR) repeat protein